MLRIFIGFERGDPHCASIRAFSARAHASVPPAILYLGLGELDGDRLHDPVQSTELIPCTSGGQWFERRRSLPRGGVRFQWRDRSIAAGR